MLPFYKKELNASVLLTKCTHPFSCGCCGHTTGNILKSSKTRSWSALRLLFGLFLVLFLSTEGLCEVTEQREQTSSSL